MAEEKGAKSAREQRLAEALRANLRRRKSQARTRDAGPDSPPADSRDVGAPDAGSSGKA